MSDKKGPIIGISILVVLAVAIGGIIWWNRASRQSDQASASQTNAPAQTQTQQAPAQNELISTDEVVGTGAEATPGKQVTVNYVGTLSDGTKFDSSYDRNQPFTFTLGAGQVIKGWDQGVAGMKVGGKRKLVIPPSLGYGDQAVGSIPPNSTLTFEIELLSVN